MNKKAKRQLHYKNKLAYELIRGGEKIDLVLFRAHMRYLATLSGRMWRNDGWFTINALGIKTERKPF